LPQIALPGSRICRSFPLIPANIEKLFADGVLRRMHVLDIGFEQRLIGNTTLQEIRQMALIGVR
jgi:hypothetical protein